MNLTISPINNSFVFKGKMTKFSKEQMNRALSPLFKYGDVIDVQFMSASSGYTKSAVAKWFQETYGISVPKYLKLLEKDVLKREMEEFYRLEVPAKEVAEYYGRSITWVNRKYEEFGLKRQGMYIDKYEQEQIIECAKAGFVIEFIAEKFKHSKTTIQKLININFKQGLVKFRRDNNIPIIHRPNNSVSDDIEIVKKCFAEGKSIKETANIIGKTTQGVLYIKEKYNLKTNSDIANERLEEIFPKLKDMKLKLHELSKEIGLSAQTIRRRIKERLGKTYTEIMREK